jgi:hypothetical protein
MQFNFSKSSVSLGNNLFLREEMQSHLNEFEDLYLKRPIENNQGGMKAPQAFYAWFIAKKINPETIIESGLWYGQGTWFFEQACPEANIICIDPNLNNLKYKSNRAKYITQDFNTIEWDKIVLNRENSLCFFDDHQDANSRLPFLKKYKFKHFMFEDNYPIGKGDCNSLKKILETDNEYSLIIKDLLDVYQELPPPIKLEKTRWGDDWSKYPTPEPLLNEWKTSSCYYEGADNYTWICYGKIK